jgi:hypothetical protein
VSVSVAFVIVGVANFISGGAAVLLWNDLRGQHRCAATPPALRDPGSVTQARHRVQVSLADSLSGAGGPKHDPKTCVQCQHEHEMQRP